MTKINLQKHDYILMAIFFVYLAISLLLSIKIARHGIEQIQQYLFSVFLSKTLFEGGYIWFAVGLWLICWILGYYFLDKKKPYLYLLFIPLVLIGYGFTQYTTLDDQTLEMRSLFQSHSIRYSNMNSLIVKFYMGHSGEGLKHCEFAMYIRTNESKDVLIDNYSHPGQKLFVELKQKKTDLPVICEYRWNECRKHNWNLHSIETLCDIKENKY